MLGNSIPILHIIKISLSLNMRTVPGVAADRRCLGEILKGRGGEERTRTDPKKWSRFLAT